MNYRSKATLLGLPIIHLARGAMENGRYRRGVAKGWIAVGDISYGILFSFGAIAVGGLAFGGLAIGLLPFAGVALGVFALGGLAVGVYAAGGLAVGLFAVGGAAIAWQAAAGGFAAAREYAAGGLAIARHANDPAAKHYLENNAVISSILFLLEHSGWMRWLCALSAIPLVKALLEKRKHVQPAPENPPDAPQRPSPR